MKTTIKCLLALFISINAFAEGGMVGNGGDAVVCNSGAIEMLDHFEVRVIYNRNLIFGSPQLSVKEKLNLVADSIRSKLPELANRIANWESYFNINSIIVDGDLVDIPDSQEIMLPTGCKIEQIAIQQKVIENPFGKKIVVNKRLWDRLSNDDKTMLIMHELLYEDALTRGHKNSIQVRLMNGLLATGLLSVFSNYQDIDSLFRDKTNLSYSEWWGGSNRKPTFYSNGTLKEVNIDRPTNVTIPNGKVTDVQGWTIFYENGQLRSTKILTPVAYEDERFKGLIFGNVEFDQSGRLQQAGAAGSLSDSTWAIGDRHYAITACDFDTRNGTFYDPYGSSQYSLIFAGSSLQSFPIQLGGASNCVITIENEKLSTKFKSDVFGYSLNTGAGSRDYSYVWPKQLEHKWKDSVFKGSTTKLDRVVIYSNAIPYRYEFNSDSDITIGKVTVPACRVNKTNCTIAFSEDGSLGQLFTNDTSMQISANGVTIEGRLRVVTAFKEFGLKAFELESTDSDHRWKLNSNSNVVRGEFKSNVFLLAEDFVGFDRLSGFDSGLVSLRSGNQWVSGRLYEYDVPILLGYDQSFVSFPQGERGDEIFLITREKSNSSGQLKRTDYSVFQQSQSEGFRFIRTGRWTY